MRLDRIQIEGFKSIQSIDLKLGALNVLIGANGAGKSNFISVFKLLNEIVNRRLQLFTAQSGGADALLHFGQKKTSRTGFLASFGHNSYQVVLIPTVADTLVFEAETCYSSEQGLHGIELLGIGRKESELEYCAAKMPDSVLSMALESVRGWQVYHFHDTTDSARIKKTGLINDNLYLRPDASNLAAFLFRLQATSENHYLSIRNTIRLVAPFFGDFILRPDAINEENIRLEWREEGSDYPFLAHQLSDGTLRFICLATLLLQPNPPSTILIDEPELGLHPYAISVLGGLMRSAAQKTQLIVSTQSVSLVNQFEAEDLLVVNRVDGATVIERMDEAKLAGWLEEYTLGELWEKNVLGGRP